MPRAKSFRHLALLGLLAIADTSRASDFDMSQIFALDAGHSYVGFQIKYMGFAKVRGRFSEVSGAIRYDDSNPALTSATVRIGVGSLDTANARRDRDLLSDQWFDAETFPAITFSSTRAIETAAGFDLVGELTIRDVTREVRIEMDEFSGLMKDVRADAQVIFVGHTVIDRKEFGVQGERWSKVKEGITGVDSKVEIELTVLAKRINEDNYRNRVKDQARPQGRIYSIVASDGVDAGLAAFDALRAEDPDKAHPGVLEVVGTMLLKEGRTGDAVEVFQHNLRSFPDAADLHLSLAEAHAVQGDFERATEIRFSATATPGAPEKSGGRAWEGGERALSRVIGPGNGPNGDQAGLPAPRGPRKAGNRQSRGREDLPQSARPVLGTR